MTFSKHIIGIWLSASKSLVIRSCRNFANLHAIRNLDFALVQSKLEYASLYSIYTILTHAIEKIQKRFLKYLPFRTSGTYAERGTYYSALLAQHNFQSLKIISISNFYKLTYECCWLTKFASFFQIPFTNAKYTIMGCVKTSKSYRTNVN